MGTGGAKIETGQRALKPRLRRTAETYAKQIRHDDGWGLAVDQMSSIVNTAEVLAILEAGGFDYDSEPVQRGLGYLVRELKKHLKDRDRGPRTRYAAFALLGLTEYPQAWSREDVRSCIEFAIEWLTENNRIDGGWASKTNSTSLSLFATCLATSAIARVAPSYDVVQKGADCLMANSLTATTWPIAVDRRDGPSPAITGLAALALFDARNERPARMIARRLSERPERWATRTEEARDEMGTHWRHMTFSICARAVLRGGVAIFDPRLRPALRYLDSIWSTREGLWSDGDPDGHFTVRGAYAAALLSQEARRSIGDLDPLSLAESLEPDGMSIAKVHVATLELDNERGTLLLGTIDGKQYAIALETHYCAFVEVVHHDGPVDSRTLCRRLKIKTADLHKMVAIVNALVHKETKGIVGRLVRRDSKNKYSIPLAIG